MIYDCNFAELDKNYNQIIDFLFQKCTKFQFVIRDDGIYNLNLIDLILSQLNEKLLFKKKVNKWHGTILTEDEAELYIFEFDNISKTILKKVANKFSDWNSPNLTEDLSFIREDESEFLTTIIHEKDAYFVINEDEKIEINAYFPFLLISK
jgi:hypothetical protein